VSDVNKKTESILSEGKSILKNSLSNVNNYFLLASIIESSEDAILSMDLNGIVTSWNTRAEKMFGYSAKEIIGKSIHHIYPINKMDELNEITAKLKKNERIEHFETERKHKDGSTINVSLSISQIKDENANIIGIAKIIRDITGQKNTSAYARSLIEASLDPLVTISPEGKVTDVNEATVKITGVPKERLIGSDFSDYFTESRKAREGYERVFNKGFVTDYPLSIKNSSGQIVDVLYNASVYKDDKGNVLGVFAAARNATRVKQKDEFSTMIAHELRTPLIPILGYCDMLKTSMFGNLNDGQAKAVEVMEKNAQRLEILINDIMDARKLDMDKMKFKIEELHLDTFFSDLDSDYKLILENKGCQFTTILDDKNRVIKTDKSRLRQTFDILINNAIKFVTENKGKIETGCMKENNKVVFYVKDNGIGILQEKQKNLFQKFYQIDTSERRSTDGTGLGLAIAKGIVEKLNGTISVESDGKTGTSFYMKFPI
jgi:PAS domain S-box-containing protein